MSKRIAAAAFALCSLVAVPGGAEEAKTVRIPDQTISVRYWEAPNLNDVFRDGEYGGVKFSAVPDTSIPLPAEYRPERLLAKLDPSLTVESVGSPPFNGPKSRDEILSSLPNTAFRLKSLFAADGQSARNIEDRSVVVYVTGYKTRPGYPPKLEDLKDARFPEEKRVYISEYVLSFGNLPPCHVTYGDLCGGPK